MPNMTQPKTSTLTRLENLHNQPTRYELALERGDTRIRICYSMRTGRHSLLTACQKHGQTIVDYIGMDDKATMEFLKPAARGARIGEWSIRFTGRTQRDAISTQSELPWIGDFAKVAA